MINVKRLRHATFTTANIEAQLDYYQSIIGLGVIARDDGRILLGTESATVQVVATATLGALVGYRDLGTPIVTGFTSGEKGGLLAGAIAVAALALLTDGLFALAERRLVPWRSPLGRAADVAVIPEEAPALVSTANPTGKGQTR